MLENFLRASEGNYSLKEMRTVTFHPYFFSSSSTSEGNYSLKEMRTINFLIPLMLRFKLVGRKLLSERDENPGDDNRATGYTG